MRQIVIGLVLLSLCGCSVLDADKMKYQDSKVGLEREIELLKLKKRKRVLELQLDQLELKEMEKLEK